MRRAAAPSSLTKRQGSNSFSTGSVLNPIDRNTVALPLQNGNQNARLVASNMNRTAGRSRSASSSSQSAGSGQETGTASQYQGYSTSNHHHYGGQQQMAQETTRVGEFAETWTIGGQSANPVHTSTDEDGQDPAAASHQKIDISASKVRVSAGKASAGLGTILESYPLLDSITLLIILLQLPTTLLTVVQLLFATLTLLPPSSTIFSGSSGSFITSVSLFSVFSQQFNNSPSPIASGVIDVVGAVFAIACGSTLRSYLFELAQVVIALSLGAGSSQEWGMNQVVNALVCGTVVAGAQVFRAHFQDLGDSEIPFHLLNPTPTASGLPPQHGVLSPISLSRLGYNISWWIRSAIAIHIVAHGCYKAGYLWIQHHNATTDANAAGSKQPGEGNAETNPTRDVEKDAASGAKGKKKSRSVYVRAAQPLWAAIASTIVHVTKELEQSHIKEEGDPDNDLGHGMSIEEADRIWIAKIGASHILFTITTSSLLENGYDLSDYKQGGSDYPILVKLNSIVWPQTRIYKVTKDNGEPTDRDDEWCAEISGLTPVTEYDFEFVKTKTLAVLYKSSACTIQKTAQSHSTMSNANASTSPPIARPLSPVTTLLNTLNSASSELADNQTNLKRVRKENAKKLATLKAEIDTLRGKLEKNTSESSNRSEERSRRRILSLKESIKRSEQEAEVKSDQLDTLLDSVPEEREDQWREKGREWETEQMEIERREREVLKRKAAAEKRMNGIGNDAASAQAKRERLLVKRAKIKAEAEAAYEEAEKKKEDARQRRIISRRELDDRRRGIEEEFRGGIEKMEKGVAEFRLRGESAWQQAQLLENAALSPSQDATTASLLSVSTGSSLGQSSYPPLPSPSHPLLLNAALARRRSNSMLSGENSSLMSGTDSFMTGDSEGNSSSRSPRSMGQRMHNMPPPPPPPVPPIPPQIAQNKALKIGTAHERYKMMPMAGLGL